MISPHLPGSEGGRGRPRIHSLPKWVRLNPITIPTGPRLQCQGGAIGRFSPGRQTPMRHKYKPRQKMDGNRFVSSMSDQNIYGWFPCQIQSPRHMELPHRIVPALVVAKQCLMPLRSRQVSIGPRPAREAVAFTGMARMTLAFAIRGRFGAACWVLPAASRRGSRGWAWLGVIGRLTSPSEKEINQ